MSCDVEPAGLSVRNLSWGPHAGHLLVRDVSMEVAPGELLAIVGANGAGKSSLLRCLYRAYRPLSGAVLVDGQDIWKRSARDVARQLAVVLQEMPGDFPFLVRDVVALGRTPHRAGMVSYSAKDREETEHALDHLNLLSFADRPFASLSGGEKQRVLVARALAQEPRLILLDEPTNHLDIRHQLDVLTKLRAIGITVVTTLHDLNIASAFADRVGVMVDGRLAAFGYPAEVLTTDTITSAFGVEATLLAAAPGDPPRFAYSLPLH